MTAAEVSLIMTSVGTLLTTVASVWVSLRNSRKLDEVHRTTNSLAQRNEAIAKELGITEGIKQEKENASK